MLFFCQDTRKLRQVDSIYIFVSVYATLIPGGLQRYGHKYMTKNIVILM